MDSEKTLDSFPKTPKKRAPVKKQASFFQTCQDTHLLKSDDSNLLRLHKLLEERVLSLENDLRDLWHLLEQEDSTDSQVTEEEWN